MGKQITKIWVEYIDEVLDSRESEARVNDIQVKRMCGLHGNIEDATPYKSEKIFNTQYELLADWHDVPF